MSLLLSLDDDPRTISLRLRLMNLATLMYDMAFQAVHFERINAELMDIEQQWKALETKETTSCRT